MLVMNFSEQYFWKNNPVILDEYVDIKVGNLTSVRNIIIPPSKKY